MSNTRIKKLVATVGEYRDPNTGEPKKRRKEIGSMFQNDKGELSIKLETLPLGTYWSGWVSCYELDPPQHTPQHTPQQGQGQHPAYGQHPPAAPTDLRPRRSGS